MAYRFCKCGHEDFNHVKGYFTGTSVCEDCITFNNYHHEFQLDNLMYLENLSK
jgi:hypothetical protein